MAIFNSYVSLPEGKSQTLLELCWPTVETDPPRALGSLQRAAQPPTSVAALGFRRKYHVRAKPMINATPTATTMITSWPKLPKCWENQWTYRKNAREIWEHVGKWWGNVGKWKNTWGGWEMSYVLADGNSIWEFWIRNTSPENCVLQAGHPLKKCNRLRRRERLSTIKVCLVVAGNCDMKGWERYNRVIRT